MSEFGAADLPSLYADMGVPVIVAGTTTKGLVDRADEEFLQADGSSAGQIGRRVVVSVQTGTLPALARGVSITVNGEAFKVLSFEVFNDGQETSIAVAKS